MYITNNFLRLISTLILGLQLLTFGMTGAGFSCELLYSQYEVMSEESSRSIQSKQTEQTEDNEDFEPPNNKGPNTTGDTGTRCCGTPPSSLLY